MLRWYQASGLVRLVYALSWMLASGAQRAHAQSASEPAPSTQPQAAEAPPSPSASFREAGMQEDPRSGPPGYREAIDEAIREFSDRNFEEARALFARAHELSPSARTERGLGMVEFELKNYDAAIPHLEAALASQVRPLNDKLRVDTERMLERANAFVTRYVLETRPAATTIKLDGLLVDLKPGQPLLVKVGEHVLELSAERYQPERRRLSVKSGGERKTLAIVFATPLVHPQSTQRDAPRGRWYKSPWLWAAVAVAAAGGATGTALAVRNRDPETAQAQGGSTRVLLGAP